jgi:hypothetical protein
MPHFECGAFNHSATSPEGAKSGQSPCGRDRLLGEVNEPDKRGADKIGPLRPEHNDFAIGCAWDRVSKAPLLGPPPREAGQSHLSLKCSRRWNRSVNEVESNGEHFCHFRCGFPDFWPYAIALPQGEHTVGAVADRWSRGKLGPPYAGTDWRSHAARCWRPKVRFRPSTPAARAS